MKSIFFLLAAILTGIFSSLAADQKTIFLEDFEKADALTQWQIPPGGGRVQIAADPRNPANHGVQMDDATDDTIFSRNVISRAVSIAGYTAIKVTVDVYSFNDEVDYGPENYDGISLRVGNLVQTQATGWTAEQRLEIFLDPRLQAAAATNGGMINIELHQYDNFSAPNDGLFFDNVTVTGFEARTIVVEAPFAISETDPLQLTVSMSPVPTDNVALTLWESGFTHGTAIFPAGASIAHLSFGSFDNNVVDGSQSHYLALTDGYSWSPSFIVSTIDDERAGLIFTAPTEVEEGASFKATVGVALAQDASLYVELKSSDPSIVYIQQYVYLNRWQSSVELQIATAEDRRILADREVTLTATLGSERIERKIIVREHNTLTPSIGGVTGIAEGQTDVPFSFGINAVSDQTVTVTLSATPSSVTITPSTFSLAPGQTSGSFTISVADDTTAQGDRPFIISAQTGPSQIGTFTGTIFDNEFTGFKMESPALLQADASREFVILAVNQSGNTVAAFAGQANIYLKHTATGAEELLKEGVNFYSGRAAVALSFPYSARGDLVVVRSIDGSVANSFPLNLFAKLTLGANDIVYDSKRQLLYAVSGSLAVAGHLNSVTRIDPNAPAIGEPLFFNGELRTVAITDNQKYLYVGQNSSYAVNRVDLDTYKSVATIPLKGDGGWANNPFYAVKLLTIPNRPLDFLVQQADSQSSYRMNRIYVNGSLLLANNWDSSDLVPANSPPEFYAIGYNAALTRFRYISGGYEVAQTQSGLFTSSASKYFAEESLVFASSGEVVDGRKMQPVAKVKFPAGWGPINPWETPQIEVTPDAKRSRVYYAHDNSIAAYDTTIYQLSHITTLNGIGKITSLKRWGEIGFVMLTDQGEVVILEDDQLAPTGPATDLATTITAAPQSIYIGDHLTYTGTIENLSTNVARETRLTFEVNPGQNIVSVDAGGFAFTIDGSTVTVLIGDLPPAERHQVSLVTTPTLLTTLVAKAAALSSSLDSDYSNNAASVALNVGFQSQPNSLNVLKLPINDVIVEPKTGALIASVAATASEGIANHVIIIDPMTGFITSSIAMPAEPGKLAVSDDGTMVYAVGAVGRTTAAQLNLSTRQIVRTIAFSTTNDYSQPVSAVDIKVLHGGNNSIIIGSAWAGARVFDSGVARAKSSGIYNGSLIILLQDPGMIFGYNIEHSGYGFFKYLVDAGGVTIAAQTGAVFTGYQQFKSDGIYIYGGNGQAMRGDLMTLVGTFAVANVLPSQSYAPVSLAADRAGQRVYFARDQRIASFDSQNYLAVRTVGFGLAANIMSLDRWGADGFVARLENGDLAIIRSDIVSQTASPIDLLVSIDDGATVTTSSISITGESYNGQGIASVNVNGKAATFTGGTTNWVATVDSLSLGENILTITATSLDVPAAARTITRKIYYVPSTAAAGIPDEWLTANFGSVSAPQSGTADNPDQDGQINLAEYLFVTDPKVADAPHFTIANANGDISVEFLRRDTANFSFTLESSSDLKSWQPVPTQFRTAVAAPPSSVPAGSIMESYRLDGAAPTTGQFYRVRTLLQ